MANFFDQFDEDPAAPQGGTGVAMPPPQTGWKVSPADQAQRDKGRLALLDQERRDNPNDVALQREHAAEMKKQGGIVPNFFDQFDGTSAQQSAAPAPKQQPAAPSNYYRAAPGEEVGPVMQFLGGAKHAWDRAAAGLQSAAGAVGIPTGESLQPLVQQGSQFVKETGPASTVGQVAGDVAMSAAPVARAFQGGKALAKSLNMVKPWQMAAVPLATEGAVNAGYGALTADPGEALQGAAWGAGSTLAGHALTGFKATPEAQALMAKGIQPSFGQSMGGVVNSLEQKATSIPFVGDAIRYARNRAQNEFETAALQRAVGAPAPVADRFGVVPRVTKGAPRTMDEANAIASQQFNEVVPKLNFDYTILGKVSEVAEKGLQNAEMTVQNKRILRGIVGEYFDPAKLSHLDGEGLKHLDSQLGYLVRKYAGGSPADKTLADEIRNVQNAFRKNLNENLPQGMEGALTEANRAWAKLVPINKASSQRADEAITPRALQRALASQARQDVSRMPPDVLVDNAVKVLPSNVPDSGTAGRLILGASGLGTAGMTGTLLPYLGAGAGAYLGATRPAQRALTGNTAWQKALAPYDPQVAAALAAALRGGQQRDDR